MICLHRIYKHQLLSIHCGMGMMGFFFLNSFPFNRIFTLEAEGTTESEQLQSELEEKGWKKAWMVTYIHTTRTTQIPRKVCGKEYN